MQLRKSLSVSEREGLDKIINGRSHINSKASQELLKRPHVAITMEAILEQQGLTDDALSKRLREIVKRKPSLSTNTKTGIKSTNQTAVDANALNAIRTAWQIKGKFVEKYEHKHSGGIVEMPEEQLDKIIESGGEFLKLKKTQIHNKGK